MNLFKYFERLATVYNEIPFDLTGLPTRTGANILVYKGSAEDDNKIGAVKIDKGVTGTDGAYVLDKEGCERLGVALKPMLHRFGAGQSKAGGERGMPTIKFTTVPLKVAKGVEVDYDPKTNVATVRSGR